MRKLRHAKGRPFLTGVLEHVDLHLHQREGLSETVCHGGLLLLKDLGHLRRNMDRECFDVGKETRLES